MLPLVLGTFCRVCAHRCTPRAAWIDFVRPAQGKADISFQDLYAPMRAGRPSGMHAHAQCATCTLTTAHEGTTVCLCSLIPGPMDTPNSRTHALPHAQERTGTHAHLHSPACASACARACKHPHMQVCRLSESCTVVSPCQREVVRP